MILTVENYRKYFGDENLIIRDSLGPLDYGVDIHENINTRVLSDRIQNMINGHTRTYTNRIDEIVFIRKSIEKSLHDKLGLGEYYFKYAFGYFTQFTNYFTFEVRNNPPEFQDQLIGLIKQHNIWYEQVLNPFDTYDIRVDINEYFEKVILKSDKLVEPNIDKEHFISFNEEDGECSLAISDIHAYNEYIEYLEAIDIPFSTGGMVGCYILKYNQEEYIKGKLDYEQ